MTEKPDEQMEKWMKDKEENSQWIESQIQALEDKDERLSDNEEAHLNVSFLQVTNTVK